MVAVPLMSLKQIIAGIERIRRDEAHLACRACGCSTEGVVRRCTKCGVEKPLHAFNWRSNRNTLRSACADCDGSAFKKRRTRIALRALRRAS